LTLDICLVSRGSADRDRCESAVLCTDDDRSFHHPRSKWVRHLSHIELS
jgi:hypothetical protein